MVCYIVGKRYLFEDSMELVPCIELMDGVLREIYDASISLPALGVLNRKTQIYIIHID